MDEMMLFPETWEEFEKQYGFYDSKQAYMYGNTRLIPSFRVQQWLDHIDDIKRKKQSQKNKMEAVAQLFGKRLGKRFTVNFYNRLFDVAFDKSGLRVFSDEIFEDELSRLLLEGLIIGNAVIVNEDRR